MADEVQLEDTPEALPAYYGANVSDWQNQPNLPPLPGGTLNAQLSGGGTPLPQIPAEVEYTPNEQWLIQRNEDERNAALGIDPLRARKAKADAEESAVRLSGQREFNQLVGGGATPEEALRRTAGKLFFNHPDKLAMALDRVPSPGQTPTSLTATPIMGAGGQQIGNAVFGAGGKLHATQFLMPNLKPPAEVVAQQKVNEAQMVAARRDVERAKKDMEKTGLTDQEKQEASRRALLAQQKLAELEKNFITGTTNWQNRITAPTMTSTNAPKPLTRDAAIQFMRAANGDRKKAEQLATDAGYTF